MHLTVPEGDVFLADENPTALADLFIVSKVELAVGRELAVKVENAAGTKCRAARKHLPHAQRRSLRLLRLQRSCVISPTCCK